MAVMGLLLVAGCNAEQAGSAAPSVPKEGDSAANAQGAHQPDGHSGETGNAAASTGPPAAATQQSPAWTPVAADEAFKPLGPVFEGLKSSEVVELSPDERILLIGTQLFDLKRRCELPYLRSSTIFQASFSGDGQWLAVCNGRGTPPVALFNLQDDTQQVFEDASYAVFSPQGSTLALIVEENEAIRLMDVATGKTAADIRGDLKQTRTVTFTPDGTRLLSTHYSAQPRMWDAASGKEIALPESRPRMTYAPVFSSDGRLLADASATAIYDTKTWEKVAEVDLPSSANDLRFAPDGSQLWVQCHRHMCVVDVATGNVAAKTSTADNIYGAAFSRDGRQAWVAHHDRLEWYGRGDHPKFELPQEIATTPAMRFDKGTRSQLVFTPDGKTLVEQASSGETVLRDRETGTTQRKIARPESGSVNAAAVSMARSVLYRFGGYEQGLVELFTLPDGNPIGEIRVPDGEVIQAVVSDDGRYLAAVIEEGPLVLLDAATGERLGTIESLGGAVNNLAIAPGGEELAVAVGGGQAELKQYALPDLREKASHAPHQGGGAHLAYSPDGRSLAVLEDYDIVVRDVATGRRTALIRDTDRDQFAYTADGRYIIAEIGTGYYDKKRLAAYDAGTGLAVHYFAEGPQAEFKGAGNIAISTDGQFLVASQDNGTLWWRMPEELVSARQVPSGPSAKEPGGAGIVAAARIIEPLRTRKFGSNSGDAILLGPDERTFHTCHWSPRGPVIIRRWDALAGRGIDQAVQLGPAGIPALSSDDGRVWLAFHKGCDFLDAATGRIVASQSSGRVSTTLACLAPDGSFALFVARDSSVGDRLVRHNVENGEVRSQLIATGVGNIQAVAVSPDGKTLAVAADSKANWPTSVQLFDLADPTRRKQLDLQEHFVPNALQFSPDGKQLLGSRDNEAFVWSTESGELLLYHRHAEIGRALAVSPDGKAFATAAHDRDGYFIAVWERSTGNLLARLVGVEFGASQLRFTADGKHLLAVEGTTLFTWSLSPDTANGTPAKSSSDMATQAATAKLLYTFKTAYAIPAIRFADNGQTIAGDGTRISLSTGSPIVGGSSESSYAYRDGPTWIAGDASRHLVAENDQLDQQTPQVRRTPRLLIWSPNDEQHQKIALAVADSPDLRPGTVSFGDYRQITANEQLKRVVTLHTDNAAYLWALGMVRDVPQVNEKQAIGCHVKKLSEAALCAEFSSTGDALLIGTPQGVELWNATNGEKIGQLEGPTGAIHLIRISPDRKVMVTFGSQGLQLWQVPTDPGALKVPLLAQLALAGDLVVDICYSADGQRIGVAIQDGPPRVYNVADGALLVQCEEVDAGTRGVAFSPDGAAMAASCSDNTIRMWRLPD